jgi:hypothetical protein
MDRSKYPPDWPAISAAVRARAARTTEADVDGIQCECRGECGELHGHNPPPQGLEFVGFRCQAVHGRPHPVTGSRVILTVAHLWRGPCAEHAAAGVKCGELEHLAAFCQRCHLAYDLPHHLANRAARRRSRRATGDLFDA